MTEQVSSEEVKGAEEQKEAAKKPKKAKKEKKKIELEDYTVMQGMVCVVGPGLRSKVDEVTKHLRLL